MIKKLHDLVLEDASRPVSDRGDYAPKPGKNDRTKEDPRDRRDLIVEATDRKRIL